MSKAIKLSESLINDAVINGKAQHRSAPNPSSDPNHRKSLILTSRQK